MAEAVIEKELGNIDSELTSAIESSVDDVAKYIEDERNERIAMETGEKVAEEDLPAAEDRAVEETGGEAPETGSEKDVPPVISDEHIERAVKAGMTMSDAREFRTPEALERVVARLEAVAESGGEEAAGKEDDGEEDKPKDSFSSIPDLDPEVYDEEIVKGFSAMKDIIRSQHSEIAELRNQYGEGSVDWFQGEVGKLGNEASDALKEAGKSEALESKFRVLISGYEVEGQEIDRSAVFKEAAVAVVGEAMSKDVDAEKSGKLKRRSRQHISRPQGADSTAKKDVYEETASVLDGKFFKDK